MLRSRTRITNRFRRALTVAAAFTAMIAPAGPALAQDSTATSDNPFFVQEDYERQLAQRDVTPEGPADQPWIQMIEPEMVDTTEFKADTPDGWNLCFSNAGVNNPWRATGWTSMQEEVKLHPEIANFTVLDAGGADEKQISDIDDLLGQDCDALIVSPNTTEALTPAVEKACEQIPVIVFDRGVRTDCPVTFIHPIGGYAFGADGAEFIADNLPDGGKVLALRILPGVDVLEHRWTAADKIFQERGVDVVGVEFSNGDRAKVKSIVQDYIEREGQIDAIWMDAGQDAVAAVEAFQDLGMDPPIITGEDQNDFLQMWSEEGLTAIAPVYSNFQWRTPVIAATMILKGEQVPAEWVLPQDPITQDTLANYNFPDMPPTWYATCGCDKMEGFPELWQGN